MSEVREPELLFIAQSMIERDALKARLEAHGLAVVSPKRDISRKYTGNTVDLSHGGYSTLFDGFKIFVDEKNLKEAKEILNEFNKSATENDLGVEEAAKNHMKKFHYFSVASVFVPLVPVLFGAYYFYKGVKNKEKIRPLYALFSLVLYLPQFAFYFAGVEKMKELGLL